MRINKNHLEALIFIAVYLFAIYMWTLPFQSNQTPYGEFDAISHWELGDFIAQRDKTFTYLPPFLDYSYGNDNDFVPHTLWYHPPFHTNLAIISSFSNDRVIPIFLSNAIFASSILISVFFVIRKLFGFLPAILSSFMLSFSMRDIMPYLWGQWPERFGYAFIPLVLYCFYSYCISYSKEGSRPASQPIYLYIMSTLLAIEMMIHPLSFFHSIAGIIVLWLGLAIKNKKIFLNAKHLGASLLIFIMLLAIFPYQSGNVVVSFLKPGKPSKEKPSLSRLIHWGPNPKNFIGSVPESYFSFKEMHGDWTLDNILKSPLKSLNLIIFDINLLIVFLLIGIIVLIIGRKNRDIFLLAWLVSLYLILHRDLIGKTIFLHRSLSATAHIFYPIIAVGALSIPTFFPIKKAYKNILRYVMAALIITLTLYINMPVAYSNLKNAYAHPLMRLNPLQIEVSEWLKEHTNETQNVSVIGPPDQIMQKVWWMASFSHRTSHFFEGFLKWNKYKENRGQTISSHLLNDIIVVDYSDIALLSDKSLVEQWQKFESEALANHTLKHATNNGLIRVYKYEAS